MFKRKLKKTAIIAACFLFIAAASEGRSVTDSALVLTDTTKATVDSITLDHHHFDASGICICLPELNEEQLLLAPRVQLNKQARQFVNSYLDDNGFFLEKIRAKSGNSFRIIDEVFTRHGLPVELKYLAVIESKLNAHAVSGAGAVGMWQLMPAAAKQFGLKVNGKVDERRNPYRSTEAAAKCIRYLHRMFDDWLLTLAAYNSGPGRVFAAIKKSGSRNFWVLQQYLPEETRKHVKKFIAMHYFFEGHGSLTTLTKGETKTHKEEVSEFLETIEPQTDEDGIIAIAR
jgi:membrane-bound lytic murein transglycosylase D